MHGKIISILLCAWAIYAHDLKGHVETTTTFDMPPPDYDDDLGGLSVNSLDNSGKLMNAPPYFQALEDFDKALHDIMKHLTLKETLDDKNLNFITVSYTVDGLAVHVAQRGWASYDANYVKLVKSLIKHASRDPAKAIAEIICVLNAANNQISKLRKIMNNKLIDYICNSDYSSCDKIIQNILDKSDPELRQEANLLLVLGEAGANYLNFYAHDLNNLTTKQAHLYLLSGKHVLNKLVYQNSLARRLTFPDKDECFV